MKNWYDNWVKRRNVALLDRLTIRIIELTEAIEGTDALVWPDVAEQLTTERSRLAWKRSDVILKLNRKAAK